LTLSLAVIAPESPSFSISIKTDFRNAMSLAVEHSGQRIVPAQLGFLAIYNPSLGTTDDTIADQIVYYYSPQSQERSRRRHVSGSQTDDGARAESNTQLRQVGLAQGMVEFGRSFSDGRSVDTIETEKSRIVLHELESGWWILAVSNIFYLQNILANSVPSLST
jgi:hypothetical protein